MKRRVAAWILAVLLLLPAGAAAGTTLEVRAPAGPVQAGEEFAVTVEITGNPTFYAAEYTLAFDRKQLTCLRAEPGAVLEGAMTVSNPDGPGGALAAVATAGGAGQDGVLFTYRFQAKQDLERYFLSLTRVSLSDRKGEAIAVEIRDSGGVQFSDVQGHWGEEYIRQAAARGLFAGYPDGRFGPDDPVTRAQFVTVLYRMAGSPAVTNEAPFSDLDGQGEEFRRAIAWGAEQGYLSGTGQGNFEPDGSLTREAAMKILFALDGGKPGTEALFTKIYDDHFPDSGEISDWAKPALYWAYYHKLINGTWDGMLSPKRTATRVELSKILVSYLNEKEE